MQMWKKNYLVIITLLACILHLGMYIIVSISYKNDFRREVKGLFYESENLLDFWARQYEEDGARALQSIGQTAMQYADNGIFMSLSSIDSQGLHTEVMNNIPFEQDGITVGEVFDVRREGIYCIGTIQSVSVKDEIMELWYMRDCTVLLQSQYKRILSAVVVSAILTAGLAVFLYKIIKYMYYPVNSIAHELRTPLTNIHGYAQFIKNGKLSEEDIYFAGKQIEEESIHLNEVIEKLLIIGNMREGQIRSEKLEIGKILEELKGNWKNVNVEEPFSTVLGDAVLVRCMFRNLIENAVTYGGSVRIYEEAAVIYISNSGEEVKTEVVEALNRNRALPLKEIKGTGYGVSICHEIAKVHNWKLVYEKGLEGGLTAGLYNLQ